MDSGKPFSQTGEATVTVFVEDVNDKRPKFERKSYTVYALESTPIGADVLRYVQRWAKKSTCFKATTRQKILAT